MDITKPMEEHFINRTKRHIDCVNKYAKMFGKEFPNHDSDKFEKELKLPYIILTWCTFRSKPLPDKFRKLLLNSMKKHYENNKHHPEHWNNINDMDEESLIEMCADWCAMSEEFNNSPIEWANNTVGVKWNFNEKQIYFIYKTLEKMWSNK